MATLKLTFANVYTKVSEYLGLGSSPSGTDLTKCKDLVKRAYRKFLMPTDPSTGQLYQWSYLQKTTTLSVITNTDTYELPSDFSSLVTPFMHTSPIAYNPIQKSVNFLYEYISQTTGTGYPRYFAIKSGRYDTINGQHYEVLFKPTPGAAMTYYYTYIAIPAAPSNDDDFFVGNELSSECILEMSLAAAELQEDEKAGIHSQEAMALLNQLIGADKKSNLVPSLGMITNGKISDFGRFPILYDSSGTQVLPEP